VPSTPSHAVVGFALGAWAQQGRPIRRVCLAAAACAALPDIDVIGWPLHISNASLFGHRAITHSIAFALLATLLATRWFFHGEQWAAGRTRIGVILGLALLSHACLDALTTYSVGVEFFAPFSQQRFRFLWTPLGAANGELNSQLVQELFVVLLPAIVLGWLGFRREDRSGSARQA
jgi:inner membrane protein